MAAELSGGGEPAASGSKGAAAGVGVSGGGAMGDAPATSEEVREYLDRHVALPEDLALATAAHAPTIDEIADPYRLSAAAREHRKRRRKLAKVSRRRNRR